MELNKNRYAIIIFFLFSLVMVLLILTLVIQNSKKTINQLPPTPTPTLPIPTTHQRMQTRLTPLPNFITPTINETVTPNLTPIEFTGVKDEPIPQEIVDYTNQKLTLMQKMPFKTTDFTIDFDYNNDKFIVELNPPEEDNQKKFENWLKDNYPSIPKDQFLFQ